MILHDDKTGYASSSRVQILELYLFLAPKNWFSLRDRLGRCHSASDLVSMMQQKVLDRIHNANANFPLFDQKLVG